MLARLQKFYVFPAGYCYRYYTIFHDGYCFLSKVTRFLMYFTRDSVSFFSVLSRTRIDSASMENMSDPTIELFFCRSESLTCIMRGNTTYGVNQKNTADT